MRICNCADFSMCRILQSMCILHVSLCKETDFLQLKVYFSLSKSGLITYFNLQTGTYDCETSSHIPQIKFKLLSTLTLPSYFSSCTNIITNNCDAIKRNESYVGHYQILVLSFILIFTFFTILSLHKIAAQYKVIV